MRQLLIALWCCAWIGIAGAALAMKLSPPTTTASAGVGAQRRPPPDQTGPAEAPLTGEEWCEPPPIKYPQRVMFPLTLKAYCPCLRCCWPHADGKVAWGPTRIPKFYTARWLAVSRDLEADFPFGTTIEIPGMGEWTVADRTHKSRVAQVELLFNTALPGFRSPHSTAAHFPTFKGLLYKERGRGRVAQDWPDEGKPFPWERWPWVVVK